jgi:hypothetical protein
METDASSGHEKSRIDASDVEVASVEEFTPAQARSIVARVDRRLVTVTGIMYCISVMDRTNLGAAAIAGMNKDLQLINNRYVSTTTLIL